MSRFYMHSDTYEMLKEAFGWGDDIDDAVDAARFAFMGGSRQSGKRAAEERFRDFGQTDGYWGFGREQWVDHGRTVLDMTHCPTCEKWYYGQHDCSGSPLVIKYRTGLPIVADHRYRPIINVTS